MTEGELPPPLCTCMGMYVINPGFFTTLYLFFTCFDKETKKGILRYGDSYLFTWQKMVFLRTMNDSVEISSFFIMPIFEISG